MQHVPPYFDTANAFSYKPCSQFLWHKPSLWQPNTDKRYWTHKLNQKSSKCLWFYMHFGCFRALVPHIPSYHSTVNAFLYIPDKHLLWHKPLLRQPNYNTDYVTRKLNKNVGSVSGFTGMLAVSDGLCHIFSNYVARPTHSHTCPIGFDCGKNYGNQMKTNTSPHTNLMLNIKGCLRYHRRFGRIRQVVPQI